MTDIQELKQIIDMASLAAKLNIPLTGEGKALCLWHDDRNPSLHLYQHNAYCFSCKKSADAIELTQKVTGLDFKSTISFLEESTQLNSLSQNIIFGKSAFPIKQIKACPAIKSFDECMQNIHFEARICCIKIIYKRLAAYTQEKINSNRIPLRIYQWLNGRGYNVSELLLEFAAGNILFVDDAKAIGEQVKSEIPNWELSGLFNEKGNLKWFSEHQYAIAFPVFHILQNEEGKNKAVVTSLRLRNICLPINPPAKKEVEVPTHENIKGRLPSSFGFIGLYYWSRRYPQLFDKCHGLTVLLTEGAADFLASCLLFKDELDTIILTAGTIAKSAHEHNLELIKKCKRLILAFDNDEAGNNTTQKVAEKAFKIGIECVESLPIDCSLGKDLNDVLKKINTGAL